LIVLKSEDEIRRIQEACRIVAEVIEGLKRLIEPGITTKEIEEFSESFILNKGARPAFKGYRGYPASVCTSVNEEVVHGIPSKKRQLKRGDIISIDIGVYYKGFYGDGAITLPVGKVGERARRIMEITEQALWRGIDQAVEGNRVSDISCTIQEFVESKGYSVVRNFVGHGIGRELHEDPQVPNFGKRGEGPRLKEGMTIAIEPMVNEGTWEVRILNDGWTAVTRDGKLSAHFEHTVAITKNGCEVLTKL